MTASPAHLGRGSFMLSWASRATARPGSPPRPAAALGPPLELPPAPPPGSVPPSFTRSGQNTSRPSWAPPQLHQAAPDCPGRPSHRRPHPGPPAHLSSTAPPPGPGGGAFFFRPSVKILVGGQNFPSRSDFQNFGSQSKFYSWVKLLSSTSSTITSAYFSSRAAGSTGESSGVPGRRVTSCLSV